MARTERRHPAQEFHPMLPLVPSVRAIRHWVVLMLSAFAALGFASTATAAVEVRHTYAGPIADGSACTAEPAAAIYGNTGTFDPNAPVTSNNVPSTDDIVPRRVAGTHADYCVAYALTPDMTPPARQLADPSFPVDPATNADTGDDHEGVIADTPEGFAAAAGSVPACSNSDFQGGADSIADCPQSAVGDATLRLSLGALELMLGENFASIYNLEAGPNEAARLGIEVRPPLGMQPAKFLVRVVFTGGSNTRLRSIVENAPRTVRNAANTEFNLYVESVALRFWGSQAAHPTMVAPAFAETGTQCGTDLAGHFEIRTYGGPAGTPNPQPVTSEMTTAPHQVTGCESLDFRPAVSISGHDGRRAVPTGANVRVELGQNPGAARATALLREARVTLPAGLEIGPQLGGRDGSVVTCSAGAFRVLDQVAPDCPAASRVGTARVVSPLLQKPLVGDLYLGPQPAVGELPDLYISTAFEGATAPDAPRIKLAGSTSVDQHGQVSTHFTGNPQLRFSSLDLEFAGGPNALFTTPRVCGSFSGASALTPWSGSAAVEGAPGISIADDCGWPQFAPSVAVSSASTQAGASAATSIAIGRPDRSLFMKEVAVTLPPGLLANLNGVPECPAWAAAAGNCPDATRIGTVAAVVGAGDRPAAVPGAIYLTERPPGAVAGATIVVRAKIGQIDFGDVVVAGRIDLRTHDAGLNFVAEMPLRVRGVALDLREVVVALDRPGFALNPSKCGPLGYRAAVGAEDGRVANAEGQISYTGCNTLPFAPRVDAELSGQVRAGGHPNVHVIVRPRAGDVNLRGTKLTMPSGVATDLRNVQVTCPQEQFFAGGCTDSTKVGWANADVTITPERIRGDVHLVKVPGQTLPGLGLDFKGRFAQRVLSTVTIEKSGRVTSDFSSIPDLPLRRLEVRIFGGEKGPIQIPPGDDWCNARTSWSTLVSGQGGQRVRVREPLACAKQSTVRLSDRGGLSVRQFDMDGRRLQSIKVTLPRGFSFDRSRARSSRYGFTRMRGSESVRTKVTQRTFRAAPRSRDARNVRIKLRGPAIRATRAARNERGRVTVKVRLAFTNGAVEHQRIRVRVR